MHYKDFPKCPVKVPIEPAVPFEHMGFRGAVPNKCSKCEHLFEGECTRYLEEVGRYLNLDHGSCDIDGPNDVVTLENELSNGKVQIPRKCKKCRFLFGDQTSSPYCAKDKEKWGDYLRGFDWGSWKPEFIYIQLPPPKVTTRALSQYAYNNDLIVFIKEYHRINPELSIKEARSDFRHLLKVIERIG